MDQLQGALVFFIGGRKIRPVAAHMRLRCLPIELSGALLRIFRDVDQDWSRAAGLRHVKGFANGVRHLARMRDQIIVLRDGKGHTGDVRFLKRIRAKHLASHLPGDTNDRRGIHHRGGDAGDHVRGARTGGGDRDAHVPRGAREAIGHMRRALLVTNQDVMNRAVLQRVIRRQNGAARVAENGLTPSRSRHSHRILAPVSFGLPWCLCSVIFDLSQTANADFAPPHPELPSGPDFGG